MDGWHHQLSAHKFEQSPGDSEGQGSLAFFSPWGHKELDMTEWLNSNKPRRLNQDGLTPSLVVQSLSRVQLCEPMDCSTSDSFVPHYLSEFAQIHVHWVGDAISPSHPLLPSSPPGLNPSQHQRLFQWVSSSHQVAKVLELQFQHQSFQWIFTVDFLLDSLVWSPCNPRYSQESSPAPQFKASILQCSAVFMVQLSHLYLTTGKTIALTIRTFMSNSQDFSVPVPPASHSPS